jgi:hypothetical protein
MRNEHGRHEAQELSEDHQRQRVAERIFRPDVCNQRCSNEDTAREQENDRDDASQASHVVARIRLIPSQTAEDRQNSANTHRNQRLEQRRARLRLSNRFAPYCNGHGRRSSTAHRLAHVQ